MTEPSARSRRRPPSLGLGVGTCLLAAGWTVGLRSFSDNSFFTHLATGRIILESGRVPTSDPYTFTAAGEPWVVQSWLASWLFASVEAAAGGPGLRILFGLLAAGLVVLAWRLLHPAASLLVRLALGVLFVLVGVELWAERPLMIGLVAFACVMLAGESRLDPRWLVPIGWLWVNTHGSFPLGVVYLIVVAAGSWLDGREAATELRTLRWLGLGVALGAVGPLGPKILLFPVDLLAQQDVLREVIEWRAPTFDGFSQRAFLVQLALAIVLLARRPSYRSGLVLAVFGAAALLGLRNVPVASLAMLPAMAASAPALGGLRSSARNGLAAVLVALGAAGVVVFGIARLAEPDFRLGGYPVDALAYLGGDRVDLHAHRMAAPDVVGNLVELIAGPSRTVFYDDRFDMFPSTVSEAYLPIARAGPGLRASLDRHEIDLVLWDRSHPTGQWLTADASWRVLYTDELWLVACRRGADLEGELGRC